MEKKDLEISRYGFGKKEEGKTLPLGKKPLKRVGKELEKIWKT